MLYLAPSPVTYPRVTLSESSITHLYTAAVPASTNESTALSHRQCYAMTTGSSPSAGALPRTDGTDAKDGPSTPNKAPATGVQAAGMRAVAARMVAFYFRAPVKAFFRGRIDYMGYARAINPHFGEAAKWSWRMTTPAVLVHAVKTQGWSFIPNQVMPPLLANTLFVPCDSLLHAVESAV